MGFEVYDYREDVRNVLVTPQLRSRFMRMEAGEVVAAIVASTSNSQPGGGLVNRPEYAIRSW